MAAFVWGDAGAALTPEQIAARRKLAEAQIAQGADYSPVGHWTQGMARVAQALLGGYEAGQLDRAEKTNAETNRKLVAELVAGSQASPAAAASAAGANAPAVARPMGELPGLRSTAGKIYANDEPSPLDPPSGADRDAVVRTVLAEAGNQGPAGMNAVASVIRNRAVNGGFGGDSPATVVAAPNQFEPWNTAAGRTRMAAIDPASPAYTAAGGAVDAAYAGNDPTNGATMFYAPKAQTALGRPAPAWDNGSGVDIGDHRFFGGAPSAALTTAPRPAAAAPTGLNPAIVAAITNPAASEGTRQIAALLMQQAAAASKVQMQDLGDRVGIYDSRGNLLRYERKGEPAKGPQFVETGEVDPLTGQPVKGWVNPADQSVKPYRPQASANPTASSIPPPPPGVDPKIWREGFSKRATSEGMPAAPEEVSKLRNEVQGLPSYKNLAQAAPVYKSMLEAAGRDTRAADVNMIYGMAKIMDPTSVVRESEMTIAQAIATLPQQLQATVRSQLESSGRLTPEVRSAMMQEARSRVGAYQSMFDQDAGMYRGIAERGRMNTLDVLPSFGPFEEFKPAASARPKIDPGLKQKYGLN